MKKAVQHFKRVDPILASAIQKTTWVERKRSTDPFIGLCRIICGQQLSVKAAGSIFEKFSTLFPRQKPTPKALLEIDIPTLRSAGLSEVKCRSLHDLALHIETKKLPLKKFSSLSDEEISETLIRIRGIGPWSIEMFLMFYLNREDIFSPGDLGLRNAIKKLYNKRSVPTPEEAARIAEKWSPYRSYACRILWSSLDNEPKT